MRGLIVAILLLILGTLLVNVNGEEFKGDYKQLSGIIIPGFASTQLRAWSILDCPYSPLDFNPLDLVWLDTTKVINFYPFNFSFQLLYIYDVVCFSYDYKLI